jgi:hypothetical protein
MPAPKSAPLSSLLALALVALTVLPAHAATYVCSVQANRGNKWICRDDPSICTYTFIVDERRKTMTRKVDESSPPVKVVVDKWEADKIIAHEDQNRLDSRFIEQYFYKIEFGKGEFLIANEYVTNSGRYLKQEELNAADPKRYSYYRPKLFSEKGRCSFKAR